MLARSSPITACRPRNHELPFLLSQLVQHFLDPDFQGRVEAAIVLFASLKGVTFRLQRLHLLGKLGGQGVEVALLQLLSRGERAIRDLQALRLVFLYHLPHDLNEIVRFHGFDQELGRPQA